jgi:hypothetical protein
MRIDFARLTATAFHFLSRLLARLGNRLRIVHSLQVERRPMRSQTQVHPEQPGDPREGKQD